MNNVYEEIIKNPKYASICRDTVLRVIDKFKDSCRSEAELVKSAREELFKIHNAYFKGFSFKSAELELKKARESGDETRVLKVHERLLRKYDNNRFVSLKGFYEKIFEITGRPKVLLDLACGLNPLTLPWMNLEPDTEYYCYDIESEQIIFLNNYFKIMGLKHKAYLQDVISSTPSVKADVAFLFKSATCFEWQREGNTLKVLDNLNVKYAVITLMMRGEGNLRGSSNYFRKLLSPKLLEKESCELVFKKEYVYIIKLNK